MEDALLFCSSIYIRSPSSFSSIAPSSLLCLLTILYSLLLFIPISLSASPIYPYPLFPSQLHPPFLFSLSLLLCFSHAIFLSLFSSLFSIFLSYVIPFFPHSFVSVSIPLIFSNNSSSLHAILHPSPSVSPTLNFPYFPFLFNPSFPLSYFPFLLNPSLPFSYFPFFLNPSFPFSYFPFLLISFFPIFFFPFPFILYFALCPPLVSSVFLPSPFLF